MNPKALYPGYAQFTVVDDPSHWNLRGWDMLAILDETELQQKEELIDFVKVTENIGGYNGGTREVEQARNGPRNYVIKKTRFLFGLSEKSALFEMRNIVDEATAAKEKAQSELFTAEQRRAEAEERLKEMGKKLDSAIDANTRLAEKARDEKSQLDHKLKEQKAEIKELKAQQKQLREYFGKAQFDKALAPAEPVSTNLSNRNIGV